MLPSSYRPLPSLNNPLRLAVEEWMRCLLARATMLHSVEVARTQEILSRFRPIAPKPSLPQPPLVTRSSSVEIQLRSRPCRARKRGRPSPAPLPPSKRQKSFLPILPSAAAPPTLAPKVSAATYSAVIPFSTCHREMSGGDLTTLKLLPASPEPETDATAATLVPVEQDLLQKLQEPRVIVPQPVRPVASTITVSCISDLGTGVCPKLVIQALAEEVEEELESDALPAVISDSRNRVRLANSAYKEMVGQPECPWLDAMMATSGSREGRLRLRVLPRRISGEVMLGVEESSLPKSANGFSCRAKIEWTCDGKRKYVEAPCEVMRLFCNSKDYCLAWRFITTEASMTTCSCGP